MSWVEDRENACYVDHERQVAYSYAVAAEKTSAEIEDLPVELLQEWYRRIFPDGEPADAKLDRHLAQIGRSGADHA